MQRPGLLALADPGARLGQLDPLDGAGQRGGELVRAHPHQVFALGQQPGMAGVVAEVGGNQVAVHVGRLGFWNFGARGCHHRRRLRSLAAAEQVVEHHERQERHQYQDDCHHSPSFGRTVRQGPAVLIVTLKKGTRVARGALTEPDCDNAFRLFC